MPSAVLPAGIEGACEARFAEVARVLGSQLSSGAHHGAAVALRHRGEPVLDIWGGAFAEDSLAYSFSTTKGITAMALHMAMERAGLPYDTPVAAVWPEFAGHGKEAVTIRQCLCHEAGIPQILGEIPDVWAMADWDGMVSVMEGLAPLWEPGTANGYHALNFGWIIGELVRRIDGRPIEQFVADEIAGPLELDGCFLATPDREHGRIVPVYMDPLPDGAIDIDALLPRDSLLRRALAPDGDMLEFVNSPKGMGASVPAMSGCFTARSLAAVYAVLERGGAPLLKPDTLAAATTIQNKRPDLVLMVKVHWRLGFMSGGSAVSPAGPNREAFGHAGYGGSVAFADPKAELSIALTLDRLERNLLGDDRGRAVISAALAAVS